MCPLPHSPHKFIAISGPWEVCSSSCIMVWVLTTKYKLKDVHLQKKALMQQITTDVGMLLSFSTEYRFFLKRCNHSSTMPSSRPDFLPEKSILFIDWSIQGRSLGYCPHILMKCRCIVMHVHVFWFFCKRKDSHAILCMCWQICNHYSCSKNTLWITLI